ncbi:MAG TPA: AI-2E family transporter [Candidatus Kapabacteria bacterium]|nr:AI-2E family transporter [Candidatus Kapabacteria bacterium]
MNFGGFKNQSQKVSTIAAIVIGFLFFAAYLYVTGLAAQPIVLLLISVFILFSFRKKAPIIEKLLIVVAIFLVYSLLRVIGSSIVPFFIAFLTAYLLDPFVEKLKERWNIARWLSSLVFILIIIGIFSAVAVFVFPIIFDQLDNALKSLTAYVDSARKYVESESFVRKLNKFGLPKSAIREAVRDELIPRVEGIVNIIFSSLLNVLSSLSVILTQVVNVILTPIMTFYLLKDFRKFKDYLKDNLKTKNKKLLNDLLKVNVIVKKYIGWQIVAAIIVATFCSISYTLFDIPYSIVLAFIAGILNPIPYFGSAISMIIGAFVMLLVDDGNFFTNLLVIVGSISTIHFINAYLIEPNVLGKQVGLHPVILIISLFVFGGLLGLIGLLIAVPATAALMMFYEEWRKTELNSEEEFQDKVPK